MTNDAKPPVGSIGWHDLTVENADAIRDFYSQVVGWTVEPHSMGEYDDYCMQSEGGNTEVGICHARGMNADLPAQWLMYIIVEDVDESAARCVAAGGELLTQPRGQAGGRFCVIRDPAGAVCGLYQPAGA